MDLSPAGFFRLYALVIFDADGTLRHTTVPGKPCPHTPCEWALLPGVAERLQLIPWGEPGFPFLGIASNQDHVGYGFLSLEMARRLLRDLALSAAGRPVPDAALQLCPHLAAARCPCRKPEPGMLEAVMRHYRTAPGDTVFVGNDETDREAATRGGTAFCWAADLFG
jgi:D-glycero-D-manno-heptose 1,7-bisphosphate phosphatase